MSPRKLSTTVAGEAYAEVSGSSLEDPTAGCDHQSGELGKGENGRQEKALWEGVSPGPSSASCVVGTETSARARLGGASIHSANCLSGEPGPRSRRKRLVTVARPSRCPKRKGARPNRRPRLIIKVV